MEITLSSNNSSAAASHEENETVIGIMEFNPSADAMKSRILPIDAIRAAEILQDEGYRAQRKEFEDKYYIASSSDGWDFNIYFYRDLPNFHQATDDSVRLVSGYTIDQEKYETILKASQQFNYQYRYVKTNVIHRDDYSFTEIEMDIHCSDGISHNAFMSVIHRFLDLRYYYTKLCREVSE